MDKPLFCVYSAPTLCGRHQRLLVPQPLLNWLKFLWDRVEIAEQVTHIRVKRTWPRFRPEAPTSSALGPGGKRQCPGGGRPLRGRGHHRNERPEQSPDSGLVPRPAALSEDRPGLRTWTSSTGAVLLECHCQWHKGQGTEKSFTGSLLGR